MGKDKNRHTIWLNDDIWKMVGLHYKEQKTTEQDFLSLLRKGPLQQLSLQVEYARPHRAVSYTHLDVYKRQHPSTIPLPGRSVAQSS